MTETAQDIEVVCQDCGETFVFTGAEAAFYKERSLSMPPKRCKECRGARGRRGNDRSPARFPTGDPNEYRSPMPCEMPMPVWGRPRTPRPVGDSTGGVDEYRSPAFRDTEPEPVRTGREVRARRRERRIYPAVCAKCGATAHVPFEPSPNREVLCKPCFDEKRGIAPPEEAQGE